MQLSHFTEQPFLSLQYELITTQIADEGQK